MSLFEQNSDGIPSPGNCSHFLLLISSTELLILSNKTNDLIRNLTAGNMTQHSRIE